MKALGHASNGSNIFEIASWTGVVLVGLAFVGYGYSSAAYRKSHTVTADTGCLAYAPPPAVMVVVNDLTDKLTGDQPRRWKTTVNEEIANLPEGSKVLFASIGATAPSEIKFEPVLCVPPPGAAPRQKTFRERFNREIDKVQARLEAADRLSRSAIRATLLAVAADPIIKGAQARVLLVESDLLENDGAVSAYRPTNFVLPATIGTPFAMTRVHFVVLRNMRDDRFQTPELLHTWINWTRAAGAAVRLDAPWLGVSGTGKLSSDETSE